jgi:hypothetical protein
MPKFKVGDFVASPDHDLNYAKVVNTIDNDTICEIKSLAGSIGFNWTDGIFCFANSILRKVNNPPKLDKTCDMIYSMIKEYKKVV